MLHCSNATVVARDIATVVARDIVTCDNLQAKVETFIPCRAPRYRT